MAQRQAWWAIPASVVVLVRVVTLPGAAPDHLAAPAAGDVPAALAAPADTSTVGPVLLQDATGTKVGPVWLDATAATVLHVPAAAGHRVDFTVERCGADGREPWLSGATTVRGDGELRLLGLQPGSYAVAVTWCADGRQRVIRADVRAGGHAAPR